MTNPDSVKSSTSPVNGKKSMVGPAPETEPGKFEPVALWLFIALAAIITGAAGYLLWNIGSVPRP